MTNGKRRLQELGGSLYISLPHNWLNELHLKKGSEIMMRAGPSGELVLHPTAPAQTPKQSMILTFGPHLYREIIREYLYGTEVIAVHKSSGFSKSERQHVLQYASRLMNTEVVEETTTKITIQHFRAEDVPLKTLVQRMYFLTHSMLTDLTAAKNIAACTSIIERDITVGKFYLNIIMHLRSFLTGRLLTKEYAFIDILDLRLLVERIEQIGDTIKQLAKDFSQRKKCSEKMLSFLAEKYALAFKAYLEKDLKVAQTFWDDEKSDRKYLKDSRLVHLYDLIKDITDLII